MAFCSACDRSVPVALKSGVSPDARPATQDAEALVCLDYKVRCTGAFCPTFSLEDDAVNDWREAAPGRERMR
jgi:hypothetical protein